MEYKLIKVHKDTWDIIKSDADKLGMTIIDYMRVIAYKNNKKGK